MPEPTHRRPRKMIEPVPPPACDAAASPHPDHSPSLDPSRERGQVRRPRRAMSWVSKPHLFPRCAGGHR